MWRRFKDWLDLHGRLRETIRVLRDERDALRIRCAAMEDQVAELKRDRKHLHERLRAAKKGGA